MNVRYVEWLIRLLAFIGGVTSTIVGSWLSSKIRVYHDNRKAHLDDLKQRVLTPLRDGLEQHFRPLVFHQEPLAYVETAAPTEFLENAKATESQIEQGDVLQGKFPGSLVFGPLDSALQQDAQKTHFLKQMVAVDKFVASYFAPAGECHAWVRRMSHAILMESGLPAFPNKTTSVSGPAPYVMHYRLAVFVYKRLFRFSAPALLTSLMNDGAYSTLNGEDATLACGSEEQVSHLVAQVNKLLESEKGTAEMLRRRLADLQKSFQELVSALDYAIAARRLRKRCDLVTFF